MNEKDKFKLQDEQYVRPYHHLLNLDEKRYFDYLWGGLDYYSYVSLIIEIFDKLKSIIEIRDVAEVGCGDGKITLELAKKHPSINFEGYDLSERAILFAKAFGYGYKNLSFYAKDFKLANKKYDVILCIETLEHIPDDELEDFIKTLHAKLKKDGKLIISVPTINLPMPKKHYRHYDYALLKEQTKKFFVIEKVYYVYNKRSLLRKIIRLLLSNRIFILNFSPLRKKILEYYHKKLRICSEKEGCHMVAIIRRR